MKRHSDNYRLGELDALNNLPFLDIAFVLLIVFAIASPFFAGSASGGREVHEGGVPENPEEVISVVIDSPGKILVEGSRINPDRLEQELGSKNGADGDGDVGVLVQAPRDLPGHELLQVIAQIKRAGVSRVAVVEPSDIKTNFATNP